MAFRWWADDGSTPYALRSAHCVVYFRNEWLTRLILDHKHGIFKQVAQWTTIAHLRASRMFGDTMFYNTQYSTGKTCRKRPVKARQNKGLNDKR